MEGNIDLQYLSIGGNRHPSAADWTSSLGGYLAYGAGNSIALWAPLNLKHRGVSALLNGHSDVVNAVRFFQQPGDSGLVVISGSADKSMRAWILDEAGLQTNASASFVLGEHDASVTSLAVLPESNEIISIGADSKIKIWEISLFNDESIDLKSTLKQSIPLKIMPLAVATHALDGENKILAVVGSHSSIQIYVTRDTAFTQLASLPGHAGWIRSVSFIRESTVPTSDLLLASGSQDKFIRLWRVHQGEELPSTKAVEDPSLGIIGRSVSTKVHRFKSKECSYSITFEALLLGHDDWIYSNQWHRHRDKLQLLSASADNSLAVWEPDPHSGIWLCVSRLGEISAQKGSTTATGSTGGFWIGLWAPDGTTVASLGRTGSWRLWTRQNTNEPISWKPTLGCGGHVRSVTDIAWSRDGGYLLSTSSDQTTRLHAEWKRGDQKTWHEFARPQIHGYDLNCIDVISDTQFVSGAEEKPMRVFQEPLAVAEILQRLCGISTDIRDLPDAANIPVLGLSNKAIETTDESTAHANGGSPDIHAESTSTHAYKLVLDWQQPPLEDHLARYLLWPEIHKVYGHGYEISAVSVSPDGSLMATACRASSIDHAVIRIHETTGWREFTQPLRAHSLTVTGLEWSPDGEFLLSVGRDRIWSIFERNGKDFTATTSKGHSRMILDCSWAPLLAGRVFATAGRDKCAKLWSLESGNWVNKATIPTALPVSAVSFASHVVDGNAVLAIGLENGGLLVAKIPAKSIDKLVLTPLPHRYCPSKTVNRLLWRPWDQDKTSSQSTPNLAVSSEDGSLRILSFLATK